MESNRRGEALWRRGGRWMWGRKLMVLAVIAARAQGGERPYCDPENLPQSCRVSGCACTDDTMEVDFGNGRGSSYEFPTFRQGMRIESSIVLRTETPIIYGWSFSLEHDSAFVRVLDASIEGTVAEIAQQGGFVILYWNDDVVHCPGSLGDPCPEPEPGSGIVYGITLSFTAEPRSLPAGTHEVLKLVHALEAEPPAEGTQLRFSNRMAVRGSPPIGIGFYPGVEPLLPRILVDGVIRGGADPRFLRGDVDATGIVELTDAVRMLGCLFLGTPCAACLDAADVNDDGSLNIVDPIHLLSWLFLDGRSPPAPFPDCGIDQQADAIPECIEQEMCQ